MNALMSGALAMGFAVAGIFFFRFWKQTRDKLFMLFSAAFFMMAMNRVIIGLDSNFRPTNEGHCWIRLVAFGLILVAILEKNCSRDDSKRSL